MNRFLFPFLLVSAIANAAEERVFLLANYHAQGATELYRSLGHIPENSLILEGGLMIWAIFDADSPPCKPIYGTGAKPACGKGK